MGDFLARMGISGQHWSAHGLLDALNRHCIDTGVRMVDPQTHRNPAAYLAWLIKSAQRAGIEPNRVRQQRAAACRAAEHAARAAETQLEAERIAAIDWAEVQAVQEQMRRDFPRRIKPIRHLARSRDQ